MEKRRRRAQSHEEPEIQTEELPVLAPDAAPESSGQPDAPRRRRRAQPPQQITQKIPKLVLPDEEESDAPELVERKPEQKRYKKSGTKSKRSKHGKQPVQTKHGRKTKKPGRDFAAIGKRLLEGVTGVVLLMVMLLKEGADKLPVLVKRLSEKIASRVDPHKAQEKRAGSREENQEIVLEAILPQDYHGRGAQHAAHQQKEAPRAATILSKISPVQKQRLITAALLIVALVSLFNIGSILLRTFRTTRLNAQLSERYASMGGDMDEEELQAALEPVNTQMPEAAPTAEPETAAMQEPKKEPQTKATPAPPLVRSTKFHHVGGDALPEMEALYNENRDLVAWINIPEVIDLPIVYRDNSYYLKRDFYKQKNTAGTIFLDVNHPFKEKTQNLLLHGHNMKDGTMFGRLTQYVYDKTYIKNHPFINLSTLWRKEQYVIFAVLDVSLDTKSEAFFNYFTHATFASDAAFTSYIRQLQLRSMYAIPIDVEPTDALLTLSTCLEENRLVIVARRMRPGETRQQMRDRIHTATRQ